MADENTFLAAYQIIQTSVLYYTDYDFFKKVNTVFQSYIREKLSEEKASEELKKLLSDEQQALLTQFFTLKKNAFIEEQKSLPSISLKTFTIPPHQVDWKTLKDGLLTADQIKRAKDEFPENATSGYIPQKQPPLNLPHAVLRLDNEDYAIFSKQISSTKKSNIHLLQNLKTKEWYVVKVQHFPVGRRDPNELETEVRKTIEPEVTNLALKKQNQGSFIYQKEQEPREVIAFIGMKLARGIPLDHIANIDPLTNDFYNTKNWSTIRWIDLAIAVITAHKEYYDQGYILPDTKPGNLIYDVRTGDLHIIDLESLIPVGKEMQEGEFTSTLKFLPPEIKAQNKAQQGQKTKSFRFDEKSMVYLIGITLAHTFHLAYETTQRRLSIIPNLEVPQNLILPRELLRPLYTEIKKMVEEDPIQRPTLETALTTLQTLRNAYLPTLAHFRDVGIINLSELLDENENIKLPNNLIKALPNFDQIYIYNPDPSDEKNTEKISQVMHQLAKEHNLFIVDAIAPPNKETPLAEVLKSIPVFLDRKAFSEINSYFYLTQNTETLNNEKTLAEHHLAVIDLNQDNPKQQITKKYSANKLSSWQFNFIVEDLFKERERLREKQRAIEHKIDEGKQEKLSVFDQDRIHTLDKRIIAINATMQHLAENYKAQTLTVKQTQTMLQILEKEMVLTTSIERFFAKILHLKTTGQANIESTRKKTQQIVSPDGENLNNPRYGN